MCTQCTGPKGIKKRRGDFIVLDTDYPNISSPCESPNKISNVSNGELMPQKTCFSAASEIMQF
jgi:hypothetical protein